MPSIEPFYKQNKQQEVPKITISYENFAILTKLVRKNKDEIMLFGIVEHPKKNLYTITQWLIPPQEKNSSTFVTTDDELYPKWLIDIPREQRLKLKAHLHTHPSMSVTPSGTDEQTLKDKIENIDDFYIRMIINHNLELRLDLIDIEKQLIFKQISLYVVDTPEDPIVLEVNTSGLEIISNIKIPELLQELEEKKKKERFIHHQSNIYDYGMSHFAPKKEPTQTILSKKKRKEEIKEEEEKSLFELTEDEEFIAYLYDLVDLTDSRPNITVQLLKKTKDKYYLGIFEELSGLDLSSSKYDDIKILDFLDENYKAIVEAIKQ